MNIDYFLIMENNNFHKRHNYWLAYFFLLLNYVTKNGNLDPTFSESYLKNLAFFSPKKSNFKLKFHDFPNIGGKCKVNLGYKLP